MRAIIINSQKGNILVMFTIGLFVLIAMSSLALDGGHLLLNKTRLQNMVDASALYAAKELDEGATHYEAREAVVELLTLNLAHSDNHELNSAFDLNVTNYNSNQLTNQILVNFYDTPEDTTPSVLSDAPYVRVTFSNLGLSNFLAQIFSFNKQVSASAQGGPSTLLEECYYDLVPMLVCGDPNGPVGEGYVHGLPLDKLYVMKTGSNTDPAIGPGNFQLIRLGDSSGGSDIRDGMAGVAYDGGESCFTTSGEGSQIPTEPGNTVGPASQGLNTRLGAWQGPVNSTDHPRDINICQGEDVNIDSNGDIVDETTAEANAYLYADYAADNLLGVKGLKCDTGDIIDIAPNQVERRILNIVIGDCTGEDHGSSNIDYLGAGCFFLTQDIDTGGQESYVVGQFLEDCSAKGIPSGTAEAGIGPHTVVLYRVPESSDS
ncbi:TadE/TadG family type IV pilus assembly protein [Colwelliaceae bacterium BS250]